MTARSSNVVRSLSSLACMMSVGASTGCDAALVVERGASTGTSDSTGSSSGACGATSTAHTADAPPIDCRSGSTVTLSGFAIACAEPPPSVVTNCRSSFAGNLEVCVHGCDGLCTTSTNEYWTLPGVPAESEIILVFSMCGHLRSARALKTGSQDLAGVKTLLLTDNAAEELARAGGLSWPLNGHSVVMTGVTRSANLDDGIAGSQVSIDPPAIHGPIYADRDGFLDPSLPAMTASALAVFEVVAGEYVLEAASDASPCAPANFQDWPGGWPGPTSDTMRLPGLSDTIMARAVFTCE